MPFEGALADRELRCAVELVGAMARIGGEARRVLSPRVTGATTLRARCSG